MFEAGLEAHLVLLRYFSQVEDIFLHKISISDSESRVLVGNTKAYILNVTYLQVCARKADSSIPSQCSIYTLIFSL